MNNKNFNYYIIFWLSQSLSQLGSAMTSFALIIWAYKQTNSVMAVSLMTFFSYLPYIIVSIFVGAFVDTQDKKTIILYSDSIAAACSAVVLILIFSDQLAIWHIYIVNSIVGFMNAFQAPAKLVMIGILVPKNMYAKASGMESFSSNLLMVVTPMCASFINSFWGLKSIIAIDLTTFLIAAFVLFKFIDIAEPTIKDIGKNKGIFFGCRDGLYFLLQNKGILYLIISMAMMNFFSRLTYENILSPMLLARSGGSDITLGIVSGVLGIGGIIGGLLVTAVKLPQDNVKTIYFSAAFSFLVGDLLMGLGQTTLVWCIAAVAASLPIPFLTAGQNVILYRTIPLEMQGRVFSVRNAIQYCTIPIGILLGGVLADLVFEPFMVSNNAYAILLQKLVGAGIGSGMAVMFLCTGVLGCLISILWYRNKKIKNLQNKL